MVLWILSDVEMHYTSIVPPLGFGVSPALLKKCLTVLIHCSLLLKGGTLSVGCWSPTTDIVIFEFYCDPGAGCDTDVQFWFRLTPSPPGAGEYNGKNTPRLHQHPSTY